MIHFLIFFYFHQKKTYKIDNISFFTGFIFSLYRSLQSIYEPADIDPVSTVLQSNKSDFRFCNARQFETKIKISTSTNSQTLQTANSKIPVSEIKHRRTDKKSQTVCDPTFEHRYIKVKSANPMANLARKPTKAIQNS